jgi:peptidylprolyl isomerase
MQIKKVVLSFVQVAGMLIALASLAAALPASQMQKPAGGAVPAPVVMADQPAVKFVKVHKLADGLKIEDVKIGKGRAAQPGDSVSVHYTGWLANGKIFDASKFHGNKPFSFQLGAGQVIKGWDIGVVGMKPGGIRQLVIPPKLAYGSQGAPPTIPPNATLTFRIHLIATNTPTTAGKRRAQKRTVKPNTKPATKFVKAWKLADGLKIEEVKLGKGPVVKSGQTIAVHYTGWLPNGTIFDASSLHGDQQFTFQVGAGQVIKGWDIGVVGMRVGGIRQLVIPAKLAYGKAGSPPTIPANTPLIFKIHLLAIQPAGW